ncbi:MAG: hypothetical protein KGH60_04125 [Candidatus Micrarchaeota archaeon]|nr:hypothetical protein [Candidatus Micrarchaeota archaeon]
MEKYIVTMLGEKDHGKSTLIGNMLIATGSTTEARIDEARKHGKRWEPGYILDSFTEERQQEMTIDTTRAEITYRKRLFELIDVPGHLELIKNMMSGASNGDFAVLMLSVKEGEGFQPQTKRHLFLSSMFGMKALIVAVNKMDLAKYDKKVFDAMKNDVSSYLNAIGFDKPVLFVPISAYNNENLVKLSKNMPWYKGKPLMDIIYSFATKADRIDRSVNNLRALVQDSSEAADGMAHYGILYHGKINVNDKVVVEPKGAEMKIKSIYVRGKKVKSSKPVTNIAVVFDKNTEIERGSIIYDKQSSPHKKTGFTAKIFLIKPLDTKEVGKLTVKMNNNDRSLKSISVRSVISPLTGEANSAKTSRVAVNNAANVDVTLKAPYPVERYNNFNEFGRFAIYKDDTFMGVGLVV